MIDVSVRTLVRQRAGNRCEYCGPPQDAAPPATFHVERIVARQHGGDDDPSNLALACYHCNLHKGPNLAGIDPDTGTLVPLFNPRTLPWDEHFEWKAASIVGRTALGRATVQVLAMNAEDIRQLRSEFI